MKTRKLSRATEDGYRHDLVPGIKATADAERLAAALTLATEHLVQHEPLTLDAAAELAFGDAGKIAAWNPPADSPGWTPARRFERWFDRLRLPDVNRDQRYRFLLALGMEPGALFFDVKRDDPATLAAKRLLNSGDAMLLERRAAALAEATGVPIGALNEALPLWEARDELPEARPGGPPRPEALMPRRVRAAAVIPLGLLVLAGLSVLVRTSDFDAGLWVDEGLSYGIADRPLSDIPSTMRLDGSPPLYYMLLHVYTRALRRALGGRPARLQPLLRGAGHPRGVRARPQPLRQPRGLDRRRARGLQPLPDAVRAGGAHVLAGRAAQHHHRARRSSAPSCWTGAGAGPSPTR